MKGKKERERDSERAGQKGHSTSSILRRSRNQSSYVASVAPVASETRMRA
jgi:hypothetical protein